MKFEVVNIKTFQGPKAHLFRVDRSTPLGNPEEMQCNTNAERFRVCNCFAQLHLTPTGWEWSEPQLRLLRKIYRHAKKNGIAYLGCHCAPKGCHAETIKKFLDSHL